MAGRAQHRSSHLDELVRHALNVVQLDRDGPIRHERGGALHDGPNLVAQSHEAPQDAHADLQQMWGGSGLSGIWAPTASLVSLVGALLICGLLQPS